MASMRHKNYAGRQTPPSGEIVETYVDCNFSQPAAITDPDSGKKVGVPLFPSSRNTPREFVDCNLQNCDVPPTSIVDGSNTSLTTKEVEEEFILVRGISVRRIKKRLDIVHGRYVHTIEEDGTNTRVYEEAPVNQE